MKNKKSLLIKTGIILSLGFIYIFIKPVQNAVNEIIMLFSSLDVEKIRSYISTFGIWAPIISFFLMIFQSLAAPLPAFLITFANASIFGWIKGAFLSWISAMAGASLCFFIAKAYGRSAIEKLTSKHMLESVDGFFNRYGDYAVLIARLLPFMSFDIVSYAAGLTSMGFWPFFWATGLGQLPATIIYSYIGGMLVGGTKKLVFGLLMLFSISIMIILIKKIWTDKNTIQEINNESAIKGNN